jgi:hypothetical protein
VTKLSARACPVSGPNLRTDRSGWRFETRLERVGFEAPASQAEVSGATVRLALSGPLSGPPRGEAEIAGARLSDTAPMRRFEPLTLAGRLELADDVWRGPLGLSDAAGARPVATLQVRHDLATASGHADIAARRLVFAKGGLQPKDLSPIGADMVSEADGMVAFEGVVDWRPQGLTSAGRFTTRDFAFRSPFGQVRGARADIRLTSLAPLLSAPSQPVGADSVDWILPLTSVTGALALRADAIHLDHAEAKVSGGEARLDAMDLPYDRALGVSGVVRIDRLDLAALIDRFNLSDKLTVQARISGAVPFSSKGGALRVTGGRLYAVGPGRISVRPEALAGAVSSGGAAGGANVQGFAVQALQDLAFDKLEAEVDSQPMGRLGVLFRINGRHDPPKGGDVRVGLFDVLRGRALSAPIDLPKGTEVNLTLDTSLNFDELLAAYAGRDHSESVQRAPAKP